MFNGKKIGLALSGGGALGAAHIGVIEEMEKAGVKPDYICGVSAGAVIGLIYAVSGAKGMESFFDAVVDSKIFEKNRYRLINGPRRIGDFIYELLEREVAGRKFADIPTKFACVATNIATGKKELINKGDPVRAAISSSAYPALVPVQKIANDYYYEGGVTCNLPAEDTRSMGADFVVGSSIYALAEIDRTSVPKMNTLAVLLRTLDIFNKQLGRYEEEKCDFCFSPRTESFRIFDFTKMREIEKRGRIYAKKNIKLLVERLKNGK